MIFRVIGLIKVVRASKWLFAEIGKFDLKLEFAAKMRKKFDFSSDWFYKSNYRTKFFRVIGLIATHDSGLIATHVSGLITTHYMSINYRSKTKSNKKFCYNFDFDI